jgi:phage gpG-like protein
MEDSLVRMVFSVYGDKQISREMLRMSGRSSDARPAFTYLAEVWMQLEEQQFQSEGLFASGGWTPLSASRKRQKARLQLDPRILHAEGALRASLTSKGGKHYQQVTRDSISFGSKLRYARVHQKPKISNPLPRRRVVEFRERDRVRSIKIIQRYLRTGVVAG